MSEDRSAGAVDADDDAPVSWREAAVARSLDSARTRAESRVQRFLDAALERIVEPGLLAQRLSAIPGVVEHGLFIHLAQTAIIAGPDDVRIVERS